MKITFFHLLAGLLLIISCCGCISPEAAYMKPPKIYIKLYGVRSDVVLKGYSVVSERW